MPPSALSLLHLCSRATTCPELKEKLLDCCQNIGNWDELLVLAEQQGLAPLLHWHLQTLKYPLPDHFRRALHILCLRHRQCHQAMAVTLHEVLALYQQAGIDVLVLKGAALSHTVYPQGGLRPMRDIDLLLRPEQAQQAQDILIERGFTMSSAPRPDDHFHLPALYKRIGSIPVCFELHTGLFPDCPPYYLKPAFNDLMSRARKFDLQGFPAYCLGHEDTLWHVFEHGFHMPLTYEPFKLISVADVLTMVETKFAEIDWQKMSREHPRIMAALPLLHHLTPWSEDVSTALSWGKKPAPAHPGKEFQGWPHLRLEEQRDKKLLFLLRDTFLPHEWWTRLYYGVAGRWDWWICRLVTHPRHVFWWIHLYMTFLEPKAKSCIRQGKEGLGRKESGCFNSTILVLLEKVYRRHL